MPWRKYVPKKGKYGPIYQVARGVRVRQDARGKWTLFLENQGKRINKTLGPGRENLSSAIKHAERWVDQLSKLPKGPDCEPQDKPSSKKADLRIRNPHDLRHTYASILLMAHQSPAYVQRQLGHSSISITVDTYGHWIPGEGRDGLEAALVGDSLVPNRVRKPHIIAYTKKGSQ